MTRKEQILNKAIDYSAIEENFLEYEDEFGNVCNDKAFVEKAFIESAKWADANPNKKLVYTKKELLDMGFRFDQNGNISIPQEIEERKKLFEAIKENGYKWNAETKTLEKLIEQKFDITTLKPFDKVLVRDNDEQMWTTDIFSFYNEKHVYHYMCVGHYTNQCIPYEGNEHLLGKTDDCDEFYKTWG